MHRLKKRQVVLDVLAGNGDPAALCSVAGAELATLLRWLDQSGLALYFAEHLLKTKTIDRVPVALRLELERRAGANRRRTDDMLGEFTRVTEELQRGNVQHAVLKGFSLVPEFCPEPWSRHQTDIDLLIDKGELQRARQLLGVLGYVVEGSEEAGEVRLGIPTCHKATTDDFLYDLQRHRQIELHQQFYESVNGVTLRPIEDWQRFIEWTQIGSTNFPVLDLPYRMLCQLLHAFRHILHGWLRVGWLFEIQQAITKFLSCNELWETVENRMQGDRRMRDACGIVVALAHRAFRAEIPAFVELRWVRPLPEAMRLWVDQFGMDWMLADFPGNRLSLFLHREFADSPEEWQRFRVARSRRRLAAVTTAKLANPLFLFRRIREQLDYFHQYWYWNNKVLRKPLGREASVLNSSP